MREVCEKAAFIALGVGVIGGLFFFFLMNDQQAWLRRLLVFAVCAAVGMVLFLMFAALSEILGRQQELDEKLMDLDQRIQKQAPVLEEEWICPQCGTIHSMKVGTCGCGASRPE